MARYEAPPPEGDPRYEDPAYAREAPRNAPVYAQEPAVAPRRRRWVRRDTDAEYRSAERADDRALAAYAVARVIRLVAGILAAIIVAGILLVVLGANPSNDIVSTVHDIARALVGPFDGMFTLDSAKATIAVNWGIAAIVYLVVGAIIARLVETLALSRSRRV